MSQADTAAAGALGLLGDLLAKARRAGADAADALMIDSSTLSHARRLGQVERMQRSEAAEVGLRLFVGRRQACVSTADLGADALDKLVERALIMARAVSEDPYCGLADPGEVARDWPDLDNCDPDEPATDTLIERARACEEAARAVDGVTNSEGAEANWSQVRIAVAATNGFQGAYARSAHSVGCAVLAGEGTAMERDFDSHSAVYGSDLMDPAEIGRRAGERAVRRLNPRRAKTGRYPVVFHPRVANSFLRHFAGAIAGPAVARGTSFLKDRLAQGVFAPEVTVVDDPHRRRGLKSKPFDAEGLATAPRRLIDGGRLTSWTLSLDSARQLGLPSTGHAARGIASPPAPAVTNLYLAPGGRPPAALIGDIEDGFYAMELMGMGVNGVTGDYSRGAAGFWIRGGELGHPVSELTLAGNLKDMFLNLTPADDLELRYGIDAPSVRIDGMTVAGT